MSLSTSTPSPDPTTFGGVYPAKVYSTADPTASKRIQMFIPQVFGSLPVKIWAPPVVPNGVVPSVGDIVWCLFQGGDPAYPTYLPETAGSGGGVIDGGAVVVAGHDVTVPFAKYHSDGTGHDEGILTSAVADTIGSDGTLIVYGSLETSTDWDLRTLVPAGFGPTFVGGAGMGNSSIYFRGAILLPENGFIGFEQMNVNNAAGPLVTEALGSAQFYAYRSTIYCQSGLVASSGGAAVTAQDTIFGWGGTWTTPTCTLDLRSCTIANGNLVAVGYHTAGDQNNGINLFDVWCIQQGVGFESGQGGTIELQHVVPVMSYARLMGVHASTITLDSTCTGSAIKCVNNSATVIDNSVGGATLGGNY